MIPFPRRYQRFGNGFLCCISFSPRANPNFPLDKPLFSCSSRHLLVPPPNCSGNQRHPAKPDRSSSTKLEFCYKHLFFPEHSHKCFPLSSGQGVTSRAKLVLSQLPGRTSRCSTEPTHCWMSRSSLDQVSRCESSPGRAQHQLLYGISGLELPEHRSAQLCSQIHEGIRLRVPLPANKTTASTSGVAHGIIRLGKETCRPRK